MECWLTANYLLRMQFSEALTFQKGRKISCCVRVPVATLRQAASPTDPGEGLNDGREESQRGDSPLNFSAGFLLEMTLPLKSRTRREYKPTREMYRTWNSAFVSHAFERALVHAGATAIVPNH